MKLFVVILPPSYLDEWCMAGRILVVPKQAALEMGLIVPPRTWLRSEVSGGATDGDDADADNDAEDVFGSQGARFSGSFILACLQLIGDSPRSAHSQDLSTVLKMAASIACPPETARDVTRRLASGELKVPSVRWLHTCIVKMDIMTMLWERHQHTRGMLSGTHVHIGMDSSPIGDFDYIVGVEYRHRCPELNANMLPHQILGSMMYLKRKLPVSCVGWGMGTVAYKMERFLGTLLLEIPNDTFETSYRFMVRSVGSDQGIERFIPVCSTVEQHSMAEPIPGQFTCTGCNACP